MALAFIATAFFAFIALAFIATAFFAFIARLMALAGAATAFFAFMALAFIATAFFAFMAFIAAFIAFAMSRESENGTACSTKSLSQEGEHLSEVRRCHHSFGETLRCGAVGMLLMGRNVGARMLLAF